MNVADGLSASSGLGVAYELSAVVMLLCAFASLGSKLFDRYISYYGIQSIVLALATSVVAFHRGQIDLWVLAGLTLVIKGIGIPVVTRRVLLGRLGLKRDAAVAIGLSPALLLGALLSAAAFLVARAELVGQPLGKLGTQSVTGAVVPLATAILLIGTLCMVIRRHTVAQLFGWLIVENGVFLVAITLAPTFAFIVEAGVFLDLVAAVLIMLALVFGLARRLAGATASELRELRG